MYRIISTTTNKEIGVTDSVNYIKLSAEGNYTNATVEDATGVAFNSIAYDLVLHDEIKGADTVVVSEFDGGTYIAEQKMALSNLLVNVLEGTETDIDNPVIIKELYRNGLEGKIPAISMDGLLNAVFKHFITIEDLIEVVGEAQALEAMRSAKLKEISKACNTLIVSGIDVPVGDRVDHFNLSIEDQSNINNLFRVVELGGTEYPYQADDGSCTVYTASEIASIYLAAQGLITVQTAYHNALKKYVKSLEDIETISTVTYGMDIPAPFSVDLQNNLAVAQSQMEAIMSRLSGNAEG